VWSRPAFLGLWAEKSSKKAIRITYGRGARNLVIQVRQPGHGDWTYDGILCGRRIGFRHHNGISEGYVDENGERIEFEGEEAWTRVQWPEEVSKRFNESQERLVGIPELHNVTHSTFSSLDSLELEKEKGTLLSSFFSSFLPWGHPMTAPNPMRTKDWHLRLQKLEEELKNASEMLKEEENEVQNNQTQEEKEGGEQVVGSEEEEGGEEETVGFGSGIVGYETEAGTGKEDPIKDKLEKEEKEEDVAELTDKEKTENIADAVNLIGADPKNPKLGDRVRAKQYAPIDYKRRVRKTQIMNDQGHENRDQYMKFVKKLKESYLAVPKAKGRPGSKQGGMGGRTTAAFPKPKALAKAQMRPSVETTTTTSSCTDGVSSTGETCSSVSSEEEVNFGGKKSDKNVMAAF